MLDQPGSADCQVFSNLRRRTSAEGTTEGDRDAYERSDSTCEQLHVRHLKAESAREGPISSECSHRPARSLSLDRGLRVRMRVGKSCAVHGPQHTPSLDRQATGLHTAAIRSSALPRRALEARVLQPMRRFASPRDHVAGRAIGLQMPGTARRAPSSAARAVPETREAKRPPSFR